MAVGLKREEKEDLSPALTRVMEAATEKGGEEEKVLIEEVHSETGRQGSGAKSDGRAAGTKKEDKTGTKARRGRRGVKRGSKGETEEAKKGLMETEGGGASVRLNHQRVQDQNVRAVQSKRKRIRKSRGS